MYIIFATLSEFVIFNYNQLPMKKLFPLIVFVFLCFQSHAQELGKPLPTWQEGYLDIHHINTGRGDAAFHIFPDGTTMLVDAGEMDPTSPRVLSPRNATLHPNYSRTPSEWIVYYIQKVMPEGQEPKIDYAMITHFHDDHFGSYYLGAKLSKTEAYYLTGITGVGDAIPIEKMIDRGYPNYNYPYDMKEAIKKSAMDDDGEVNHIKTIENYWNFVDYQVANAGMKAEKLQAGRADQITLQHKPDQYENFKVQNVKSNGTIWKGEDTETFEHLPDFSQMSIAEMQGENPLSLVIRIDYGNFRYYTGGDCPSIADLGKPAWFDVGTPVAKAVGEVDVAVLDHHGNRDSHNEFNVSTLRPRVWIEQTWSSDHPGHEVLRRITSTHLYPGPRDLFATNMLEPNKNVIGPSLENSYKSMDGHIVLRVMPGGDSYYVIILDDETEEMPVKSVFGPYQTKTKKSDGS